MSHFPRAALLGAMLGAIVGALVLPIAASVFGLGQDDRAAWAASVIGVLAAAGCGLGYRQHWRASAAAVAQAAAAGHPQPQPRPSPGRAAGRGALRGLGWGGLVAGTLVLVPEAIGGTGSDGLGSEGFLDALVAMVPTFAVIGALAGGGLALVRAVARN